jgi:hypothetical protein
MLQRRILGDLGFIFNGLNSAKLGHIRPTTYRQILPTQSECYLVFVELVNIGEIDQLFVRWPLTNGDVKSSWIGSICRIGQWGATGQRSAISELACTFANGYVLFH